MVSFFTVYRFTVKSPESHFARKQSYVAQIFSEVARNFIMLNNIQTS